MAPFLGLYPRRVCGGTVTTCTRGSIWEGLVELRQSVWQDANAKRAIQRLNEETSTRRRGFTVTVGRCTIRDSRGLISSAQMNNELLA